MNYGDLKVDELRALCKERGLKVHRAKADMVKELKEYDAAQEIKDYYGEEPAPLPDGVLPASDADVAPEPQPGAEIAPEEPGDVVDGRLYKAYTRHSDNLSDAEHQDYLNDVIEEAVIRGLGYYGPSFRAADECTADFWVYAVNVR